LKALNLIFLPLLLSAVTIEEKTLEEQSFKNKLHLPKGLGLHTDLAYNSYLIELHSSEVDSAIDYDVLEATLGLSYAYDKWLFGMYGKFLLKELESNMFVVTSQSPLNNHAQIDKNEFGLYVNYTLQENSHDAWRLNAIYRYASLDAFDAYRSFLDYNSHFKYQTNGLAFSLQYQRKVFEKGLLFANAGLLYSQAKVKMSESVNGQSQDSFVNDTVKALGSKFSFGYQHSYAQKLSLHIRTDVWRQNFERLAVTSQVGDSLPKASLKEQSYSTYMGLAWRF